MHPFLPSSSMQLENFISLALACVKIIDMAKYKLRLKQVFKVLEVDEITETIEESIIHDIYYCLFEQIYRYCLLIQIAQYK